MSNISLATADALHRLAQTRTIRYYLVDDPLFRRFWAKACQLERAAAEAGEDDILRTLLRQTRRVRYELSSSPLLFSDPVIARGLSGQERADLLNRISQAYPSLAAEANELVALTEELFRSDTNPLLDRVELLDARNGSSALVIRKSRLLEAVEVTTRTRAATSRLQVVDPESLHGATIWDRLILVGPVPWFPDYVFSAPRANEIHVISFRWLGSRWRPHATFITLGQPPPVDDRSTSGELDTTEVGNWPDVDWQGITERALGDESDEAARAQQDLVEARLFTLNAGLAVFLEVTKGSTSLVIDPREEDEMSRVRRVISDEIAPGTFLLLRTEGGGDYIVPLADQILGDRAKACRAAQRHWKERLRDAVAGSSEEGVNLRLLDVSLRLSELGSKRADEANVRHWISARNIVTRDKGDFKAIMDLIGLGSEVDQYWALMRQIRAAHLQAGRRIRRLLIERVRTVDLSELEQRGRLDVVLPEEEGGCLTALLVEGRSPARTFLPASREGRVFERED